jgi:hypothetical protein
MCQKKWDLFQSLVEATAGLLVELRAQSAAVIAGDAEFVRFDDSIAAATERKNAAKEAYEQHVCSGQCESLLVRLHLAISAEAARDGVFKALAR